MLHAEVQAVFQVVISEMAPATPNRNAPLRADRRPEVVLQDSASVASSPSAHPEAQSAKIAPTFAIPISPALIQRLLRAKSRTL